MIDHLKISNFAIVDSLDISFSPGLSMITGETGAGKSIILGAFSMLLGGKVPSDIVRPGATEATLEALFNLEAYPEIRAALEEAGLPNDEDLLIRRVISATGRSKIFLNGQLANASILQKISEPLVEMCSQHENQSLLKSQTHVDVLDRFGSLGKDREVVQQSYQQLQSFLNQYKEHLNKSGQGEQHVEFLRFQIKEIEKLELKEEEEEELIQNANRLSHSENLTESLSLSEKLLESAPGAIMEKLALVQEALQKVVEVDDSFRKSLDQIKLCKTELEDVTYAVRRAVDQVEHDPARLDQLNKRISHIHSLKRKYGTSIAEILEKLNSLKQELSGMENFEERREELEGEIHKQEETYLKVAKKLSGKRKKVAEKLSQLVEAELRTLGMQNAVFFLISEPKELEKQPFIGEPSARSLSNLSPNG